MPVAQKRFPDSEGHQAKRESKKTPFVQEIHSTCKVNGKERKNATFNKIFYLFLLQNWG